MLKLPTLTNWRGKDSVTYTALITERSVPPPDPPGSPECTQSPTGPNPCEAVSRFLHQSAFTTSSCKRPVTSPAIVRKQITTYADQKVGTPRTSGTIPERTMPELGKNGKKASPFLRYTILETVMNPEPLAILRTSPSIQRK